MASHAKSIIQALENNDPPVTMRDDLIKHLKTELQELKNSSQKFNDLYDMLVQLEQSYHILREEKKRNEGVHMNQSNDYIEQITEATEQLKRIKEDHQGRCNEMIDLRNKYDRLNNEVETKQEVEATNYERLAVLKSQNDEVVVARNQIKDDCEQLRLLISNIRNSNLIYERDLIKSEVRVSQTQKNTLLRQNDIVKLDSELQLFEHEKNECTITNDE